MVTIPAAKTATFCCQNNMNIFYSEQISNWIHSTNLNIANTTPDSAKLKNATSRSFSPIKLQQNRITRQPLLKAELDLKDFYFSKKCWFAM